MFQKGVIFLVASSRAKYRLRRAGLAIKLCTFSFLRNAADDTLLLLAFVQKVSFPAQSFWITKKMFIGSFAWSTRERLRECLLEILLCKDFNNTPSEAEVRQVICATCLLVNYVRIN